MVAVRVTVDILQFPLSGQDAASIWKLGGQLFQHHSRSHILVAAHTPRTPVAVENRKVAFLMLGVLVEEMLTRFAEVAAGLLEGGCTCRAVTKESSRNRNDEEFPLFLERLAAKCLATVQTRLNLVF